MLVKNVSLFLFISVIHFCFLVSLNAHPRSWDEIKQSKVIKAIKFQREEESQLPRSGSSSLYHLELIKLFAAKHHLNIEWINVGSLPEMLETLKENRADLIPRNLTITKQRKQQFGFTNPIKKGKEVLIGRTKNNFTSTHQNIKVSLPLGTAYIESVQNNYPNWKINKLQDSLNANAIADAISKKEIEFSILDQQDAESLLAYRDDIKIIMTLKGTSYFSWATVKNNHSLLTQLNDFISLHQANQTFQNIRHSDLNQLKKNNLSLRVITRNSPETYFLWKGELVGFEYELMKRYAKEQNLRLEIVVADSYSEMTKLLEEGKGDLIAAGLSRTQDRRNKLSGQFNFSSRYARVSEELVSHIDSVKITKPSDLKGRIIGIRKSSAFNETAKKLANQYGAKIKYLDDELPTELIIEKVAKKELDLTIADSNLVDIEKRFRSNIISPLTFKKSIPYAYIIRKDNRQLLLSLNQYIKSIYRGTFYNVVKNKYFGRNKHQESYREFRIKKGDNLSPFDDLVKKAAEQYQFDWRLITAQMFQESRFNQSAKSNAGALGLMQVLPRTAKELGISDLSDPVNAVNAGVKYLDWTRQRFENSLPVNEQIYFSLASYNAGFGHVRDAQRLAKEKGLNPTKWFNHVEKMMLLLQKPEFYKHTRFGYCRGSEPVNYVRSIQQRYLTYSKIKE